MTVSAPDWFTRAIETPRQEGTVDVQGAPIHYLEWGDASKPGIVFVHGGSAHAHWWTHLAPMFTERYHPVAIDMSGHGDSGRRDSYAFDLWAEEIMAVGEACGMETPPVLVGHSMGGLISIVTAALHGDRLRGAIIVDSPVTEPDPEREEATRGRAFRNPKTYPDLDTALEHFRLVPTQPPGPDYVMDYIARNSLHEVADGWTWKFDPNIFARLKPAAIHEFLAGIQTRVALFRGELSHLVTPDVSDYMHELLGRNAPVVAIPEAYHHLIIDQPLAFVSALRAILADWEHTVPRKR
ncbi:MAG: alpha/beta hydrolase [Acidimicrobiia bacterium]|nr:alpha/beta hydrolase [Acidimicrobiia bacterium]MBT8216071.1 alpha/beta hydrolase [Acidimicrobiia bacterium]NNF11571.1 alpha/beta hydrolase [Acidimicrobiia bacterium]NNL70452.1 alpha/beta hydrolase [Acidimicrobiia bacterium]